jgi:hypothetical protein
LEFKRYLLYNDVATFIVVAKEKNMGKKENKYDWNEIAKKPSSLLIYLTLERYARSQPMRREEVIRRIHEDYGLWLSPKTISENAAIYKALSQGEEPVMDFHHLGKKGYLMGKSSSQFSLGELVWILDHFAAISPEARAVASQQLRPYASQEDWSLLEKASGLFAPESDAGGFDDRSHYFSMIAMVAKAFASHREIRFFHEFVSPSRGTLVQESVRIVPLKLFLKNGQYYVLGARLPDEKGKGEDPIYLYIASFLNIHDLSVGSKHLGIGIESCCGGEGFNFETLMAKNTRVLEGFYAGARRRCHPVPALIFGALTLAHSRNLYGDRVQVNATYEGHGPDGKPTTVFDVELNLEPLELMSWYFLFAPKVYLVHQTAFFESEMRRRAQAFIERHPPRNKMKDAPSKA